MHVFYLMHCLRDVDYKEQIELCGELYDMIKAEMYCKKLNDLITFDGLELKCY